MTLVALLAGLPPTADAARLFTVDFNGNDINEIDGSDDVPISFTGSTGAVMGFIRAVNITAVIPGLLDNDIDTFVDFSVGGTDPSDFNINDVLIFDLVLSAGSAPIDEVGVAVGTDPSFLNPDGAGYLDPCTPGIPLGCSQNVPVGQTPDAISLSPGFAPFFPGAALFGFGKGTALPANLTAGETSIRMFVAWGDLLNNPGAPLNRINQTAVFMISSGTNQDFFTDIVPEPNPATLLGLGLVFLGLARNYRRDA